MRVSFRMCAALGLALAVAAPSTTAWTRKPVAEAALVPLDIVTAKGTLHFQVEVARTDAEQERGLMFRKSLRRLGGMIFPMKPAREATFWMKNTLIPLDMIFIREDGHIARIAADVPPLSLDIVDSGEPVVAVLEISGGGAARAGIEAGNVVHWQDRPVR